MDLEKLNYFTEKLRREKIGDPIWIPSKNVYEYQQQSLEVVSVLKIIRAAQGVNSMNLLCKSGLFIDLGALRRCVNDCTSEVAFLLEQYPEQSVNVKKFVKEFYSNTIDNLSNSDEEIVQSNKIRNASIRELSGKEQDEDIRQMISRLYKITSGYVHAGYSHTMEMYGGPSKSFNLSGIPSQEQKDLRAKIVDAAKHTVILSIGYSAQKFDLWDLYDEIKPFC